MNWITRFAVIVTVALISQSLAADTPSRVPPRMKEFEDSYRLANAKLELPHTLESWKIDHRELVDKKDNREDLWLFGARPTMLVVFGRHAELNITSKNKAVNKQRADKLRGLFKEIDKHADANKNNYDVVIVSDIFDEELRQATFKLFSELKSENTILLGMGFGGLLSYAGVSMNHAFSNYWDNYIRKPEPKMIKGEDGQPSALLSWVWMPTVGTIEAWGVWGIDSEMARLKKFEKLNKPHDALKLENKEHAEIAKLLIHWRLGEAEKALNKLEKSEDSEDIKAAVKLREFELLLEKAYRSDIAEIQKNAGYLVEYAEAMGLFAEKYYSKSRVRGKAILDELKKYRKSDAYKHAVKAKKESQKLRDSILNQIGKGIHGKARSEKYDKVLKKNKKRINEFNKRYGDTPYSKEAKNWAKSLE